MRRLRMAPALIVMSFLASAIVVTADPPLSSPPDFVAPLTGLQEVPIRVTDASGMVHLRIVEDGQGIAYRLTVQEISNVVAAHLHLGPRGVNAPVVAFLYGDVAPGGGPISGHIAEGVIHASDLRGPLLGQSLSVLIEAIRTGGVYANAHTNDGIAPTNTGPGDFPGGEIRAQVQSARANNPNLFLTTEPAGPIEPAY